MHSIYIYIFVVVVVVVKEHETMLHMVQYSIQFSSGAQLGPILCDPLNRSTPGLPTPGVYSNLCPSSR